MGSEHIVFRNLSTVVVDIVCYMQCTGRVIICPHVHTLRIDICEGHCE